MKSYQNLIIGISFLAVGWVIAFLLRATILRVLEAIKFDKFSEKIKLAEFLKKGKVSYTPSKLVAILLYWLIVILVLFGSAEILGISVLSALLDRTLNLLPQIFSSLLLLIVGILIASFLGNLVQTATSNAKISQSYLLGRLTKVIVITFIIIIILEQLNIGATLLTSTFQIILGAIAFALALAFGLGAKDIAKELLEKIIKTFNKDKKWPGGPDLEG